MCGCLHRGAHRNAYMHERITTPDPEPHGAAHYLLVDLRHEHDHRMRCAGHTYHTVYILIHIYTRTYLYSSRMYRYKCYTSVATYLSLISALLAPRHPRTDRANSITITWKPRHTPDRTFVYVTLPACNPTTQHTRTTTKHDVWM